MNYLAHLFLSRHHPEAVIGNYLTDLMTIEEIKVWPGKLDPGVLVHRMIDSYTDRHKANRDMKRILRPYFHKYAGVALDLYYDFILGQYWSLYSDVAFSTFAQIQYRIIQSHQSAIPARLQSSVKGMIAGNFLLSYTTMEGQEFAFSNMDRRARYDTGFDRGIDVLKIHMDDLAQQFHIFFPDMIEEVELFVESL